MKLIFSIVVSLVTIIMVGAACKASIEIGITTAAGMIMFMSAMGGMEK